MYDSPVSHLAFNDSIIDFASEFKEKLDSMNILIISENNEVSISAVTVGIAITLGMDFNLLNFHNTLGEQTTNHYISNYNQMPLSFGWIQSDKKKSFLII